MTSPERLECADFVAKGGCGDWRWQLARRFAPASRGRRRRSSDPFDEFAKVDRGYFSGEEILAWEAMGVTARSGERKINLSLVTQRSPVPSLCE